MIHRVLMRMLIVAAAVLALVGPATAQDTKNEGKITVAAASDLRCALGRVVDAYKAGHKGARIDVIYGSSGKLTTQIEQGAPFDLFFSADSDYPKRLVANGKAAGRSVPYAVGHLVLWSASLDMRGVKVSDLSQARFGRIAIANPKHAPYGKRAKQALRSAGLWEALEPRIIFGDNVAQAAQFAATGNARVGIIAESLAMSPSFAKGSYARVPGSLHAPLLQSFVLTKQGSRNALAKDFSAYVQSKQARAILARYAFDPPASQQSN